MKVKIELQNKCTLWWQYQKLLDTLLPLFTFIDPQKVTYRIMGFRIGQKTMNKWYNKN
jgi:hypothetical protein